jgi:hypothetical protein
VRNATTNDTFCLDHASEEGLCVDCDGSVGQQWLVSTQIIGQPAPLEDQFIITFGNMTRCLETLPVYFPPPNPGPYPNLNDISLGSCQFREE